MMDTRWYHQWGYLLLYIAAYLVFVAVAGLLLRRRGLHPRWLALMQLAYMIGMGAVAHALVFVVTQRRLSSSVLEGAYRDLTFDPRDPTLAALGVDALALLETTGGLWGGPLAVVLILAAFLVVVRESLPIKAALGDTTAVALPLSMAVAKMGCLLTGCCYGVEGEGPAFVVFGWVGTDSPVQGKCVFPTQALDVVLYLLWAGILGALHWRGRARGRLLLLFVLLVGVGRFLSEFTRGDHAGESLFGLTPVQFVLLAAVPLAAVLVAAPRRFRALMAWKSVGRSALVHGDPPGRWLRWMAWIQVAILLLAFPLFPVVPLLLLVSVPLLLGAWLGLVFRRDDPLWRGLFTVAFVYLAAGFMFVSAFLVVHQGVTLVGAVVLIVVLAGLYSRQPAAG